MIHTFASRIQNDVTTDDNKKIVNQCVIVKVVVHEKRFRNLAR